MRKSKTYLLVLLLAGCVLSSCKSEYLNVAGVAYQSIRAKNAVSSNGIPSNAKIVVVCQVNPYGWLDVTVRNNTDKIMTIDRTKSFFRDGMDNSIAYYDPMVTVSSQSTTTGSATGGSVNLGSLASAAGIGGALGTALGGVNVGGSNSTSTTSTETAYHIDQPQIHIAPHGSASMGRKFEITGVGKTFLGKAVNTAMQDVNNNFTSDQTYAFCNICISYSLDNGATYETILTDLYANTLLVSKVRTTGKVNDALRKIYAGKNDALIEQWYLFHFESAAGNDYYIQNNEFINYK